MQRFYISLFISFLAIGFVVTGCSREDNNQSETQTTQEAKQLYSCGMHPNVIQEGPGNCPICGMKLTPIGGGVSSTPTTVEKGERKLLYWRAPMDPTYISPGPGKSPMGMDLIPVYEGEEEFGATVKINPVVEQNMGIRTVTVGRRNLHRGIRTIGRIVYDESKVAHVHTKFSGWIEKTHVNITGQAVGKGGPLLDIYSPKLVSAQEEYLDALRNFESISEGFSEEAKNNLKNILVSTERRLGYFDISDEQIEHLKRTRRARKTMTLMSPFDGIVVKKHALDGMEVKPGMMLYSIADLSTIWVYADIYEFEVPWVREGQSATMTLSYNPGKTYKGKVQYIYPYLEEKTRTIKVRLSFLNPNLELKPGMYANVEIETSPIEDVVSVPTESVIFSGERNLVFVALGEGRFAPRDITIGIESRDGYYEVKEGLSEGETVVTSGQFMLDSESKLQESIAKMLQIESPEPEQQEKGKQPADQGTPISGHEHNYDLETHKQEKEHKMTKTGETVIPPSFGTVEEEMLTYYTCPMESHSYVKMKEPGECPDCGMQLVKRTERFDPEKIYYTCPMPEHSYIVVDEPGSCLVCGMNLVQSIFD